MNVKSIIEIDEIIENAKTYDIPEQFNLGPLSAKEMELIHQTIGYIAENEEVFSVLWSARGAIYEVVRAVKSSLKVKEAEFKGIEAEGKQLTMHLVRPRDIKKSGARLTTWKQSVTAGVSYFESESGDEKITMPEHEGRVYLGWVDPISEPKLEAVKYELATKSVIVPMPFELCKDYNIIRHKAIRIYPKDSYRIQVRYSADGEDMARPIAVIVTTAEKLEL